MPPSVDSGNWKSGYEKRPMRINPLGIEMPDQGSFLALQPDLGNAATDRIGSATGGGNARQTVEAVTRSQLI
jgi:hypothetical protein